MITREEMNARATAMEKAWDEVSTMLGPIPKEHRASFKAMFETGFVRGYANHAKQVDKAKAQELSEQRLAG